MVPYSGFGLGEGTMSLKVGFGSVNTHLFWVYSLWCMLCLRCEPSAYCSSPHACLLPCFSMVMVITFIPLEPWAEIRLLSLSCHGHGVSSQQWNIDWHNLLHPHEKLNIMSLYFQHWRILWVLMAASPGLIWELGFCIQNKTKPKINQMNKKQGDKRGIAWGLAWGWHLALYAVHLCIPQHLHICTHTNT